MRTALLLTALVCLADAGTASAQSAMTGTRISVTRSATVTLSSLLTPSSSPDPITADTSFPALDDSLTTPVPGPSGAVGHTYVLTALNDRIRIQTKTGGIVGTTTLNAFWSGVIATSAYGPKVAYDPFANRWIMIAGGDPRTGGSSVLFAVSATDDPTGTWYLKAVDVDEDHAINGLWTEDVKLGFNKNWIVATANMYWGADNWDGPQFDRTYLYAFDKSALYANAATALTRIWLNQPRKDKLVPVVTYDDTIETEYLVQVKWECTFIEPSCDRFPSDSVNIFMLDGPVGSESVSTGPAVRGAHSSNAGDPWSNETSGVRLPQLAAPASSVLGIETQKGGIASAVYRGGSIFAVHTIQLPVPTDWRDDFSADVSAVQFLEFTPTGVLAQLARIFDPTLVKSYAYPSLAVNSRHDVLVGFTRFGADQYPSAGYAFRAGADPRNQLRPEQMLKEGEGRFDRTIRRVNNRPPVISWGDYSSTVVDPDNDLDLWTLQQYAASRIDNDQTGRWGTWWGRVSPPSGVVATSIVASRVPPVLVGTGTDWTITAYSHGPNLEYMCWLYRRADGTWRALKNYDSFNTCSWFPFGSDVGEWLVQAWVREAGSTVAYDSWVGTDFFEVRVRPRLTVTLVADEPSPLQAGETVAFRADVSNNEGPVQYKFWMFDQPLGRWRVVQEYSSNPVFIWSTSASDAGTHSVQVWARHTNQTRLDAEADATIQNFTVVSAQPAVADVLPNVPLPMAQGSAFRWTAYGVGASGSSLEYRFWKLSILPGQQPQWTLVRDYSTSNVFDWPASASQVGLHLMQVWVRRVGSTADYEGFANSSVGFFVITSGEPPPRPGVSISPQWPVVGASNRPISFSAFNAGTPSMEYRFWLYDLATNTRTMIRDYSPQSFCSYTFSSDSDLGTKEVEVWVRRIGSPLDLEVSGTSGLFVVRRALLFHPE